MTTLKQKQDRLRQKIEYLRAKREAYHGKRRRAITREIAGKFRTIRHLDKLLMWGVK